MKTALLLGALFATSGCSLYFDSQPSNVTSDDVATVVAPSTCGPVEVHVIGIYTPTTGAAQHVEVRRSGHQILVVSSYEPVTWTVDVTAPDAHVDAVYAFGYHAQTVHVVQSGEPAEVFVNEHGATATCGYSWPYRGGGCDTGQLIEGARRFTGLDVSSFHGCYQATSWVLNADASVDSTCDLGAGYEVDEFVDDCVGSGTPPTPWTKSDFSTAVPLASECHGERFVKYDATYGVWVGAVLCGSADRYKLLMSSREAGPFLELADYAGHGQDHCELVNPDFTIPDEDDIASGGCDSCSTSRDHYDPIDVPLFARANFGEPFLQTIGREWADLSSYWISCGVAIGGTASPTE